MAKMKRTINSKPERFYALHMAAGLAEYRPAGHEPFRVLITQDVANEMDPTFEGCPVYVLHEDDVDLDNLDMSEVDGLVSKSFFNKYDGNNWVEFMAYTDQAKEAIRKGWKVSNCSITDVPGPGGKWQGADYRHSIKKGHYEHLAIVPNPRYTQSMVLTPKEFAEYNATLEEKLTRLNNSAEDEEVITDDQTKDDDMKLGFFNVEIKKLENSDDISKMSVTLPKSKKTVTVSEAVIAFDEAEHLRLENADKPKYANDDDKVKLENGEEMSIKDIKKAMNAMKKKNQDGDDELQEDLENAEDEDKEKAEKNKNADDLDEARLMNTDDEQLSPAQLKAKLKILSGKFEDANFSRLKNASKEAAQARTQVPGVVTRAEAVKQGAQKYGSSKK